MAVMVARENILRLSECCKELAQIRRQENCIQADVVALQTKFVGTDAQTLSEVAELLEKDTRILDEMSELLKKEAGVRIL